MRILLILILSVSNCYALDAVVTVLETPMLRYPSLESPVVQYLRKGDVIKVDPSLANKEKYDAMAPKPDKQKEVYDKLSKSAEWTEDPMFKGTTVPNKDDDEFVRTLDRQGKTVYVIREHLYIYYDNQKELDQKIVREDPTDYRLDEPLPKKYPLYSVSGYRGQILFGLTQPYYESYPYASKVKTKGYTSPFDLTATALRRQPHDKQDRYYVGATFNLRYFSNTYNLVNGRQSEETGLKIGVGPYLSYDAFKGEQNRINMFFSLNLYFFNQLFITQKDKTAGLTDDRVYSTYTVVPRIGVQYHRKAVLEDIDFVIGTSMEVEPPTTYRANSAPTERSWWRGGAPDKFNTRATFTLAGFIGFQSAY
jgi:hypothetical protein